MDRDDEVHTGRNGGETHDECAGDGQDHIRVGVGGAKGGIEGPARIHPTEDGS